MYESYWGFKLKPFDNVPDPRFYFPSEEHEEALMRLVYVIRNRKGAALLSGVYGCGKTLLTRAVLQQLEGDLYRVAKITNPRLDDMGLMKVCANAMGIPPEGKDKAGFLIAIENHLLEVDRDGKHTLVIVDEAHTLTHEGALEEIRMLLNFQLEDRFLLTLLFVGQPELDRIIDANKQLSQRIAMRYTIKPFDRVDTQGYVEHRVKTAGNLKSVFTSDALDLIHSRSGGIPRRINHICDISLLVGFSAKDAQVSAELVEESVRSMGGGE